MVTIHFTVDYADDHFTCGTDIRTVEMSALNVPLRVSGAHMQMLIKMPVHSADSAGQRNDFKGVLKMVGVVFFLICEECSDSNQRGLTRFPTQPA